MQLQFVARGLASDWPDLDTLVEADIPRHAARFRGGVNNWIIQTFLRLEEPLRAAGFSPTIGESFVPGCINLAHRDSLNRVLAPYCRSYVVGVRADRPPLHLCKWEIVQNNLAPERSRTHYLPFWPQPGLIERDRSRGARIERIVYFGRTGAAPHWFYDARFHAALSDLSVTFEIRDVEWFDYSEADLVLAHRTESATMLRHKPASKLVNAWLAGTPALVAEEPAYASLKRSTLDYIAIESPDDVIAAIVQLRASPSRYAAMAENGRRRGAAFNAEAAKARWLQFLLDKVAPDARFWQKLQRTPARAYLEQIRRLAQQKLATKRFKWRVWRELRA